MSGLEGVNLSLDELAHTDRPVDRERPGFFGRCGTVVRRDDAVVALVIAESGADDHCILTASADGELIDAARTWLIDRRDGASLTLLP
ncbi:MAG: hypothetical protein HKN01_11480, partial [Acidimicrobiia bacterium]|nr:hypothetical protein [Acidimicrobiia bacterium]